MATPSANYLIQARAFTKIPNLLVKFTVPGTITGEQIFRFSLKEAEPIHLQIGEDVRTYLLDYSGRPTIVRPDRNITERSNISLTFLDDPDPPNFDSSVFTVNTGGSFFNRLIVAQPDLVGVKIEVFRGFVAAGFT